jgi:hypothetical protein
MVYGFDINPTNDPYVKIAQEGLKASQGLSSGVFLVDAFPICKCSQSIIIVRTTHNRASETHARVDARGWVQEES